MALVLLSGCVTDSELVLEWDNNSALFYKVTRKPFPIKMNVDVEVMLASNEILQKQIKKLKSIPVDHAVTPLRLSMTPDKNDSIDILAINTKISYSAPPANEKEKKQRQLQALKVGVVQLNTTISNRGWILGRYTKPQQKNFITLLFYLPGRISRDATWEAPVTLTSLNTSFIADKTERINKVWVNSIKHTSKHGAIAEIVYLVQEKIYGDRNRMVNEAPIPFKIISSYFAVGEFLIDKQQWKSYRGRLDSTSGLFRNVSFYGLIPEDA